MREEITHMKQEQEEQENDELAKELLDELGLSSQRNRPSPKEVAEVTSDIRRRNRRRDRLEAAYAQALTSWKSKG